MRYWGMNGYHCRMCRKEEEKKYFNIICQNCHKALKKQTDINEIFADNNFFDPKNIILCKTCFSKQGKEDEDI
jgi:hypothetical protein